jgi:hypothetical protein
VNVRLRLDLVDQVPRHRRLERSPGHEVNLARMVCQLHHGLSCRVRSPHDHDVLRRALLRLDVGRRVVQALALEAIRVLRRQPAIVRARRQDDTTAADALTVGQRDLAETAVVRL